MDGSEKIIVKVVGKSTKMDQFHNKIVKVASNLCLSELIWENNCQSDKSIY